MAELILTETSSKVENALLGIYQVNDWAYVAAHSLEELIDWYRREFPEEEIHKEDCYPVASATIMMRDGEDDQAPMISIDAMANRMLQEGEKTPFLVAIGGYYA